MSRTMGRAALGAAVAAVLAIAPSHASAYGDQYFVPNSNCHGVLSVEVPGGVQAKVAMDCFAFGTSVYLWLTRNGAPYGPAAGGGANYQAHPWFLGYRYFTTPQALQRGSYQACLRVAGNAQTYCSQRWTY